MKTLSLTREQVNNTSNEEIAAKLNEHAAAVKTQVVCHSCLIAIEDEYRDLVEPGAYLDQDTASYFGSMVGACVKDHECDKKYRPEINCICACH